MGSTQVVGLDYFGARYFSGAQGRFTSPDPKQLTTRHLSYPQKWNKYAYVQTNPLIMVDPDGLDDIYVFRPLARRDGARWAAIKAEAKKYNNTVITFNGAAATEQGFRNAYQTPGVHVVFTGHSLMDSAGRAGSLILGDGKAAGVLKLPAMNAEPGIAATPVTGLKAADVAAFSCKNDSQLLSSQYSGPPLRVSRRWRTMRPRKLALKHTVKHSREGARCRRPQAPRRLTCNRPRRA